MITFLNRKELICTFDMQKQARVREILRRYDIPYEVRVSAREDYFMGERTAATGEMPVQEYQTEYLIYVKKEDYDRALFLVERNLEG